jgi:hypothetical protein
MTPAALFTGPMVPTPPGAADSARDGVKPPRRAADPEGVELPLAHWEDEVGTRAAGRLVLRALERVREGAWEPSQLDDAVRVSARRLTRRQARILAAALCGSGEPALADIAHRRLGV